MNLPIGMSMPETVESSRRDAYGVELSRRIPLAWNCRTFLKQAWLLKSGKAPGAMPVIA